MGLDVTKKVTVPRTAVLGPASSEVQQHDQPLELQQPPLQQQSAAQHCQNPSDTSAKPRQANPGRFGVQAQHDARPGQQRSLQQLQQQASHQPQRSFVQQATAPPNPGVVDLTDGPGNAAERAHPALQAPFLQPSQLSAGSHTEGMRETPLSLGDRSDIGRDSASNRHRARMGLTPLHASTAQMPDVGSAASTAPDPAASARTPSSVFFDLPQQAPAPAHSGQRQDQGQSHGLGWGPGQVQVNQQDQGLHSQLPHGFCREQGQPGFIPSQSSLQQYGRPPVQPLCGRADQPTAPAFGLSAASERLHADSMDQRQHHHAFQAMDCSTDAFASHQSTRK